jgi:hypothetical protein
MSEGSQSLSFPAVVDDIDFDSFGAADSEKRSSARMKRAVARCFVISLGSQSSLALNLRFVIL